MYTEVMYVISMDTRIEKVYKVEERHIHTYMHGFKVHVCRIMS